MIYLLLADGFEEVEALAPLDLLRRAGAQICTVAIGTDVPTGSHGIRIFCDMTEKQADPTAADMLILPGGMPGAENLDASHFVDEAIKSVSKKGGHLAAICAAPLVLGRRGLLNKKSAVCYPGFENELVGAKIEKFADVVTDGNITTAKGVGVAFEFGLALVRLLFGAKKASALKKATMHPQTQNGTKVVQVE